MHTLKELGAAGLLAAVAWAAGPPARSPARLTAEQQRHVDALLARATAAAAKEDFEAVAKLAERVAKYRATHQGPRHHEAIDAAFLAERWRRRAKIPAKARGAVVRALGLYAEAERLAGQGKYRQAERQARAALDILVRALGEDHPDTARSYHNVAVCLHALGKYEDGAKRFRAAALGWEFGRLHAGRSGFDRSLFRVRYVPPREGLAACLVRQGKAADAWEQAEAELARGLLEDLAGGAGGPDRDRLARVEALNARLIPLLARSDLPEAEGKRRDALLAKRAELEAGMAREMLGRADARTLPLRRVQKQIPADAALVLWIDLGPLEHLGCVVRDRGAPAWVRLPGGGKGGWGRDDFLLADRVQEALRKSGGAAERSRLLAALYKQRIAPLERHLKGVKRLLVVPTGRMARVPVEALTDRYTLSYVPSASVYAKRREGRRPLRGETLLVLADPTFTAAAPPEPPAHGVLPTAVVPGGAADRAGLRPGDLLLRVGTTKLRSPDDLDPALRQAPCEALAWRDGKEIKVRRLEPGKLSATVDKRSAREAVRAWRREQQRFAMRGGDWPALPGTRVEMEMLKGLVGKHTALTGKEASERRLEEMAEKGELKKFRLLHLATHGEASAVPEQCALVLAQHRQPTLEENAARARVGKPGLSNRLTVEAVLRSWDLDADLVTLSLRDGSGGRGGRRGHARLQPGALAEGRPQRRAVALEGGRLGHRAFDAALLREPAGQARRSEEGAGPGRRPGGGQEVAARVAARRGGEAAGQADRLATARRLRQAGPAARQEDRLPRGQGGSAVRTAVLLGRVRAHRRARLSRPLDSPGCEDSTRGFTEEPPPRGSSEGGARR
jgi:tetratricopeptide (TPR) repeat protein